jgi:predicted transposase YbfD/YdcC
VIVKGGNDYLIGVKGNQKILHKQVVELTGDKKRISSSYIEIEVNRGRTELRHTMVSDCIEGISRDWRGLKQLVCVHRIVNRQGRLREEFAYFISSKNANAFLYAAAVRSHWEIENSLHYVKDVTFEEDASKIAKGNAPQNMSTIKNIAINILRNNEYNNMAQAMRMVAHDIEALKNMIT